jgi:hypothetical protein
MRGAATTLNAGERPSIIVAASCGSASAIRDKRTPSSCKSHDLEK